MSKVLSLTSLHLPPSCEWHSRHQIASRKAEILRTARSIRIDGDFIVYADAFLDVIGPNPRIDCIIEKEDIPLFHEAGVYISKTDEIFVTSNQYRNNGTKQIEISKIFQDRGDNQWRYETLPASVHLANGAVNYRDGVLFCEQGTLTECGGLTWMSSDAPYTTEAILTNYHGRWFNSVNDVVVHSDGSIWFTDPQYGFEQGIRPRPQLPNQVYRFDPKSGDIRAVVEDIARPNGLCFSPDEKTMYITDTDGVHGEGEYDPTRGSSIFAFDVVWRYNAPFLMNKRLFAFCDRGVPDGIKCDTWGNVYSGCGDGVHVWSQSAELIGKIRLPQGHCSNFCFGRGGEMFLLNEHKVWRVQLSNVIKGALLRI